MVRPLAVLARRKFNASSTVRLREHRGKVDLRIHEDPVNLAVGAGNEPIEAYRAAESHSAHVPSLLEPGISPAPLEGRPSR
jgi:hypothetical protein